MRLPTTLSQQFVTKLSGVKRVPQAGAENRVTPRSNGARLAPEQQKNHLRSPSAPAARQSHLLRSTRATSKTHPFRPTRRRARSVAPYLNAQTPVETSFEKRSSAPRCSKTPRSDTPVRSAALKHRVLIHPHVWPCQNTVFWHTPTRSRASALRNAVTTPGRTPVDRTPARAFHPSAPGTAAARTAPATA